MFAKLFIGRRRPRKQGQSRVNLSEKIIAEICSRKWWSRNTSSEFCQQVENLERYQALLSVTEETEG